MLAGKLYRHNRMTVPKLIELCLWMLVLYPALAAQPSIRITQVDSSHYPRITVHVLVTENGKPISDAQRTELALFEDGKQVQSKSLSKGWPVSSVLVLDRSGSMVGEKLEEAKAAAIRYVEVAPDSYQVAVIAFSGHTQTVSGFTNDKALLRSRIQEISSGGPTALQDAIAAALEMLKGRKGRRALLVLTDGMENASVRYPSGEGLDRLLQDAAGAAETISTVGLCADVNEGYLRKFEDTGGLYVSALDTSDLQGIFEKSAGMLASEQELEFTSGTPDGRVGHLKATVTTREGKTDSLVNFVAPEFIPDVRGHLAPYFGVIMALIAAPGLFGAVRAISTVRRFRALQMVPVRRGSNVIGLSDPNAGLERPFQVGDPVIMCPSCSRPHHVRSWRNNSCKCMYEPVGRGQICYRQIYPGWVRRFFDALTHEKITAAGRVWLCRCRGDKEGY